MKVAPVGELITQPSPRGDVALLELFRGEHRDPGNFEWSLVRVPDDYVTPRHRHSFSQLALTLDGRHSIAPNSFVDAGTVVYTCEGTFYGPQHGGGALILSLQYGEASGNGFLNYELLRDGRERLAQRGTFEAGLYRYQDGAGVWHNEDAYTAIFEELNGHRPAVVPARYQSPIIIHPPAFNWRPSQGEPGVCFKRLGVFSERGTSAGFLRLERGAAHRISALTAPRLHYLLSGSLQHPAGRLDAPKAMMLEPHDNVTLEAVDDSELFVIQLPDFSR